jgi:outer membrane protein OmpA-like peptidoglycan-associated protein
MKYNQSVIASPEKGICAKLQDEAIPFSRQTFFRGLLRSPLSQGVTRSLAMTGLIMLTIVSGLFAQSYKTCKADRNFLKPDYEKALNQYKNLYKKNNTNELRVKIAESYRMLDSLEQAADWYKLAVNSGDVEAQYVYNYGQVLRVLEQYSDAKVQYQRYNVLQPGRNGEVLALSCDLVDKFKRDSARYTIIPVSFNSESDDFSSLQFRDGIIFASTRYNKKKDMYDWYTKPAYFDLYFAQNQTSPSDSATAEPVPLKGKVNSWFHEGPAALADSSTMYFTSSRRSGGSKRVDKNGYLHFQIYSAQQSKKGKWKKMKCFTHNDKHYSVGHPALSADGSRMIFTSDLAGGYGGFDLYVAYKEDKKWGKPVNLGSTVNSAGNEMFPRFGLDNKLYFASDGQMGLGGFDVYVSTETQEGWGSVTNLGYPLNTSLDDFGLEFASPTTGFISSNRKGGKGMDDIYFVTIGPTKREVKERSFTQTDTSMILLIGNIVNPMTDKAEGGVEVTLVDKLTNMTEQVKTDADGYFAFEVEPESIYELKLFKDSLSNKNLDFNTLGVSPGDTITFSDISIEGILLKDIYYGYNEYKILPTAYPIMDSIITVMKEKPDITVDIGGYTDSRGSFAYNLELSYKRAYAAQEYLVSKGIAANRISITSYGEQFLLNKCVDGVKCSEEEHRVNRRTVFKISKPVGL